MKQRKILILLGALAILAAFLYLQSGSSERPVIVAGTANPGKILIYSFDGNNYKRSEIDSGYNLIWTVRIGDIYNKGKNVIVAGVGNSFFAQPFGCSVIAYEPTANGWKKDMIDSNVDLRCKDLAIGNVYNDGQNELVLGTHGEGIIGVYKWDGNKWNKQEIDRNFISQIDQQQGTNHQVPVENLTYDTTVQTAVHIVKIGDILNDGSNEIVATESSPLEYVGQTVSFVNLYKWNGTSWTRTTIHSGKGVQDRSILIGNVDNSRMNKIVIGANPGKLFLLSYNGTWNSEQIFSQSFDKNMKGLDLADLYSNGKNEIVLATGIPNSLLYSLEWNGQKFASQLIGNISQTFSQYNVISNLSYNSLDVQAKNLDNSNSPEIVVAGEADTSFGANIFTPNNNVFGWETTPYGFLVVYKFDGKNWIPQILDQNSVLGMTVGKLQIS